MFQKSVWDLFFPPKCASCNRGGKWFCDGCKAQLKPIKTSICFGCGRLTEDFKICKRCRYKFKFSRCFVGCVWREGILRKILHKYKYGRVRVLSYDLGDILINIIKSYSCEDLIITSVPLHFKKRWQRGFNHSALLASVVTQKISGTYIENLLIKTKPTKAQVGLSRKDRLKNLQNSFEVNLRHASAIQGRTILIIDDVITTGATINACADALKRLGAKEVWGLVIAKS
ncbi:MAG: ComF family protein [Patescibacteria group bacterium]|nr:ComF family protein [Patescibacteria group bacterium]